MKIGIIVHSSTGNTYSVAQKLMEKLKSEGHTVDTKRIEPIGGDNTNISDISKIKFDVQPDVSQYDALLFAGPVRGFCISPVLAAYLALIPSLKGKKVGLFVTQMFPFPWMGGNHAIAQMKNICAAKGAVISETGIVNWKSKKREEKMITVVEKLSRFQ